MFEDRALLLVALLGLTSPVLAEDYVYDGVVTGMSVRLDVERQAVSVGESVYGATYCAASEEFRCFDSQAFAFAVPKSNLAKNRTWKIHGKTYTLTVPLHKRTMLGREYEACVIESSFEERGESVFRKFLYSPKSGLLAVEERIVAKGHSSGDVYVSRRLAGAEIGRVGYGAE